MKTIPPYAGTDNPAQRLDLYLPEQKTDKARPLLVFIHGGAWRSGTKAGGGMRCHAFDPEGDYKKASLPEGTLIGGAVDAKRRVGQAGGDVFGPLSGGERVGG